MAFTLPNPTVPTNGQTLDATPLLENLVAIAEAISSFDGSQIQAATVVEAAFANAVNPRLRASETIFDHVASGCVWSGDSYASTLNGSMTGGTVYINGYRVVLSAIVAHTFTANKDTYIDVDYLGNITYTEVTNNAASPSLAGNSIRLAIVVSGASAIAAAASVNQGQEDRILPIASSIAYSVTDSVGNLICPRDPSRRLLGYKQVVAAQTGVTAEVDATGLAATVLVPSGRKIKITSDLQFSASATDSYAFATIKESSTYLKGKSSGAISAGYQYIYLDHSMSPTAGAHTYKIAFQRGAGTGNISLGAAAAAANTNGPVFIRIELEA